MPIAGNATITPAYLGPVASLRTSIIDFYRRSNDVARYLVDNDARRRDMAAFYRKYRSHIGPAVLDLACGGGTLGAVVEPHGHRYVGVDINPDMIRAARAWARSHGSGNRFVLGDAARVRLEGRFDTVAVLGNALCHIEPSKLAAILDHVKPRLRRSATLIVDYRDVVDLLAASQWRRKTTERSKGRVTRFEATGCDTVGGSMLARYRPDHERRFSEFRHAIWAPFIMDAVCKGAGWRLRRRTCLDATAHLWTDVFERA
jgi:SAM-dependent methyltransferase